jgi:hypothetical protein
LSRLYLANTSTAASGRDRLAETRRPAESVSQTVIDRRAGGVTFDDAAVANAKED